MGVGRQLQGNRPVKTAGAVPHAKHIFHITKRSRKSQKITAKGQKESAAAVNKMKNLQDQQAEAANDAITTEQEAL